MKDSRHRRRRVKRQQRRPAVEHLEPRCLLSADDLSSVRFWDGETSGPPDCLMNGFGGNPVAGVHATVSCEATTVHSGSRSLRISTNQAIPVGGFDFVGAALAGFGPTSAYVDTRDVTNFSEARFWLKNGTGAVFQLVFEIKDYRDSNDHRARFPLTVGAGSSWSEYAVPLDLGAGWTVIGSPDLSRAKLFAFVIEAPSAVVNGSVYLDDVRLIEKGGTLNPQTAPFDQLVGRMAKRQFLGLWGSRDHTNALVPLNSAYADVMALNSTAGLVQVLPSAIQLGWITQAQADDYVADLVATLHTVWDNVEATGNGGYIPPRYIDRVRLTPMYVKEESPADAAFLFLALYQYRSLDTTAPALAAPIDGLLDRFDFAAFSSVNGWKLAYQYDTASFTPGVYDGYSTEIYVISLASHLAANQRVDIGAQWNSGTNRVLDYLVDPTESHLVHTDDRFRAPFLQWLFPLFADVSQRGDDTYPDPALRRNPYWNAVLYQREVLGKLALLGRPTFAQPDAADDGTGTVYEQFSLYNDFGQPNLFMPWSATFGLQMTGDLSATDAALRNLFARDLHGPLGISDSVVWPSGVGQFTRLPARQDFWNIALSTMAMVDYLTGQNADFAALPAVDAALDEVLPVNAPEAELSVPQSLVTVRSWITFTPTHYNPNLGQFPNEAELRADLEYLYDQGWRGLVTYTMDGTLREVPRIAKDVGFTNVIVGIYWWDDAQLGREKQAAIEEFTEDPTYFDGFVVGNEGLFTGRYTRDDLEEQLDWFRAYFGKPVTTTETGGQYLDDPTLMDLGDWVFPNIQPYFIDNLTPAQAVASANNEFLAIQDIARNRILGRVTVAKEIWWPTGSHADATPANQSEFFRLLMETPTLFVWGESFDQTWKSESATRGGNPGPYWGLNEEDRTWKNVIPRLQTVYTERYPNTVDYGDAPDPDYPTLAAHGGAGHVIVPGYCLGELVAPEPDGQPTSAADGDTPDEDGVRLLTAIVPGSTVWLEVTASAAGYLNAWLDVNDDADWDDPGEHFADDVGLVAGANQLSFAVPPDAVVTPSTFARFRFSTVGGLPYTGLAPDGEVEDYEVAIESAFADDIVGRNQYGYLWVAKSNGSNAFSSSIWGQWSTARTWSDVMVGDFNGDGDDDLVGRNEFGYWWVAASNGGAAFTSSIWGKWEPSRTWTTVMVGDFNRDGFDDLVGRNEFGYWWVAASNGAGAFTSSIWGKWDTARTWTDVTVGDFNKDGRSDLVARNEFGYWWVAASNGSSAFANSIWGKWDPARTWSDVMVGDFNADGADDLIGRNNLGYWWVAQSNGSSAFSNAIWSQWSTARTWTDVMLGDFDGNGAADVVGRNEFGYWWVAKSNGTNALTNGIWGQWDNSRNWTDVMVGDFNHDGYDDVVGRDRLNYWWVGKSNGWDQFAHEYWGKWNAVDWFDVLGGDFGT